MTGIVRSAVAPEADAVLREAKQLHALLDGHGAEHDREGRLSDAVVEQLRSTGAFGVFTPREWGGAEMSPTEALDLISTLSYADPSSGWVTFAIGFATGLAGAFLDHDAAAELFAQPDFACAGQGTRAGRAVRTERGYLLSGNWSFASGIKHATHVFTSAIESDTGRPLCLVLPKDDVDLVDNWDVMGLRGTGSIDYSAEDVLVPANHVFSAVGIEPVTGGPVYRIGAGNFAGINHGAWALGVGRRLLDELSESVRGKAGQPGALADSAAFTEDYATAEVKLRSAKALLYEVWEEIEQVLAAGDLPSVRHETLSKVALNNATWQCNEIAGFVYASGGSAALRSGTLQRLFRDMHGGTQHFSSSRVVLQSAGQELCGLAEGKRWSFHALI
ncbi:acyl-CoA dehydrogenase family protein [Amycolatopsis pithecellobii]|uniref:Acyl-CoA dehydrogenase n=1 Tax=Amycolatopsis pithecellobii TaxID=664692 RepID=A0A6N7YI15_9PSEU|nr:acyl-CoA dehydrogenase family protein [Amycolatopsis pithecellobii]MTD52535.1 acyl-CoA dehydrogenase [Amycolatopsis pithecellobii]